MCVLSHAASIPRHRFCGARVAEVGAGTGLPSLYAAKAGAHSVITDLAKVVPLLEENIAANGLASRCDGGGCAEARALEWGAPGCDSAVAALATPPLDLLLACDTCYIDPVRILWQRCCCPRGQGWRHTLVGPRNRGDCE